ncbi:MAG: arylamine N-acetyltransferase [Patulibacter minatonensis]
MTAIPATDARSTFPWARSIPPLRDDLLERYLAVLGVDARPPSHDALAELQLAHLLAIPFETISPMLGEAVPLAEEPVIEKLLCGHRGGYCFEHNLTFARALRALGYDAEVLAGRVLFGAELARPRPRTHAAVRVRVDGGVWLADVGFGRQAFRGPIDLGRTDAQLVAGFWFRIGELDGEILVETGSGDGTVFTPQTLLDPRPALEIDLEQLNLWVHTDLRSIVRGQLIALRPLPVGRRSIRQGRLVIDEPGRTVDRELTLTEVGAVLREEFGLELPAPLPGLVHPGAG